MKTLFFFSFLWIAFATKRILFGKWFSIFSSHSRRFCRIVSIIIIILVLVHDFFAIADACCLTKLIIIISIVHFHLHKFCSLIECLPSVPPTFAPFSFGSTFWRSEKQRKNVYITIDLLQMEAWQEQQRPMMTTTTSNKIIENSTLFGTESF